MFRNISKHKIGKKNKLPLNSLKNLDYQLDRNLKTVDFLDMTFDLEKNLFKPFQKLFNSTIYFNKNLNHL